MLLPFRALFHNSITLSSPPSSKGSLSTAEQDQSWDNTSHGGFNGGIRRLAAHDQRWFMMLTVLGNQAAKGLRVPGYHPQVIDVRCSKTPPPPNVFSKKILTRFAYLQVCFQQILGWMLLLNLHILMNSRDFPQKKSNWYAQSMSPKDAIDSTPDLAHSGVPPQVPLGHSLQHTVDGSEIRKTHQLIW